MIQNPMLLFFFRQEAEDDGVASQSFFDIIVQSGALGIAIFAIMLVLSFIGLYIFIERYLSIKKAAKIDEGFMNNIRANVGAGNVMAAKALCQNTDSPMARILFIKCSSI